jgi:hypothetical protein
MQTYIPKICSIFLLTNRCSNSKIQLCKQMFVTSVRGIYNTDLQLMIQGGTVMRNESNTITGRTCQMSGNTSSRMHSGDVSRNRRIVVRRQKIALVSVAFIALAIVYFYLVRSVLRQHHLRFPANIIQVLKYRAVILYGRSHPIILQRNTVI